MKHGQWTKTIGALVLAATSSGCSEDAGGEVSEPPPEVDWMTLECDPIAPAYCGHPFPSNVFTVADEGTPTGRRVAFSTAMMPVTYYMVQADPGPWSESDGFSPGAGIMVHLPGATSTGLPSSADIESSLDPESPTVLLDASTGERVPHFAELDLSAADSERALLFVRPAIRLHDATRYIVAIRGVVDAANAPIEPSAAFAALRDRQPLPEEPSVEGRRALYADIFTRLGEAGIEREALQIAWDFTTASEANNTERLVHMRDEALAMAGDAPAYEITGVDDAFDDRIAFKIDGTFEAPLYLDQPGPGAVMSFGPDGLPEPTTTASFAFELLIPRSAMNEPASLLQFGHGLLRSRQEIESDELIELANTHNFALVSTDWIGLTGDDQPFIGAILDSGKIEDFTGMFARLQQATVNALVLMRTATRSISSDPTYGALLDPEQRYYYGISLGGIMGALYMSLSTDVTRAGLEVMGAPFGLLLGRSRKFDAFFDIASAAYEDPRDVQFIVGIVQMLWDRVEPNGFLPYLARDESPGTPPRDVMMRAAVGDHSVTTLGAHYLARGLHAPLVDSGVREVWGLPSVAPPHSGTAYFEYDFGLPPAPTCALPQRKCTDPHGAIRRLEAAQQQLEHFLRGGEVESFCPGGHCSFPELAGCSPDEDLDTDPCAE